MKQIGLTGNSGSGKSSAAEILRELGAFVVDCDRIAHQILAPGEPAYREVVDCFGTDILEGGLINRKALGARVFACREDRRKLEEITHRQIGLKMEEEIAAAQAKPTVYRCIVLDAPLLIESGLHKQVDSVWIVTAPRELCAARIMARESLSREEAFRRLDAQLSFEEYARHAHVILVNDGDRHSLCEQVKIQFAKVVEMCSASSILNVCSETQ